MKKQKEEKERIRRAYAPKGQRSQKPMSLRIDNEIADWLATQTNKGRYINDLVKADMMRHQARQ